MTEAEQRYVEACERVIAAQDRVIETLLTIANTTLDDIAANAVEHIMNKIMERKSENNDQQLN